VTKDEFKKLCYDIALQIEVYGTMSTSKPLVPKRSTSVSISSLQNMKLPLALLNSRQNSTQMLRRSSSMLKRDWDDFFVYSYNYDANVSGAAPIVSYFSRTCIYPVVIPIGRYLFVIKYVESPLKCHSQILGNMKREDIQEPNVSLSVTVSQKSVTETFTQPEEEDHFDLASVLEGLSIGRSSC
jgi:hypothetical protein